MSEIQPEWYMAVMVMSCTVGSAEADDDLVDLQCRLIRARDPEEAFREAMVLGARGDHAYENADGQVVRWEFKGIHRLERIMDEEVGHGSEVYSTLVRAPYQEFVATKESLWESWLDQNKHRKVIDILGE